MDCTTFEFALLAASQKELEIIALKEPEAFCILLHRKILLSNNSGWTFDSNQMPSYSKENINIAV
ncbi:hypothetical protein A3860_26700 [Niastella vici]|uniref:Uncharacterized protein n=1 Tax=Niastella vici TaxID=1703345 RepID=A0A1V9FX08_9BACT|nr:hypothetical protein A3860_26700 [Niastella vici]